MDQDCKRRRQEVQRRGMGVNGGGDNDGDFEN